MYTINDNILKRKPCLSTFSDMFLEIVECLNHVNRSIYGLPVIVVFIAGNINEIIKTIYSDLLFPKNFINDRYNFVLTIIELLMRIANHIILYGTGHYTEQEVYKFNIMLLTFL